MEKRVGIIGYGSIGKEIIAATRRHEIPNARIVALFDKESTVFNSVDYDTSELHLSQILTNSLTQRFLPT